MQVGLVYMECIKCMFILDRTTFYLIHTKSRGNKLWGICWKIWRHNQGIHIIIQSSTDGLLLRLSPCLPVWKIENINQSYYYFLFLFICIIYFNKISTTTYSTMNSACCGERLISVLGHRVVVLYPYNLRLPWFISPNTITASTSR